ncbi:MAG: hypothetical protein ABI843_07805 [Dokdonella sp.]
MSSVTGTHPAEIAAPPTNATAAKRMPWWQWLLVYPTLLVSMFGALPALTDLLKAWSLPVSVPLGKARDAQEQLELLKTNFACTEEAMNHPSTQHGNVSIGAIVCATGDVAIVAQNATAGAYPNPIIVPLKAIVGQQLDAQASLWNLLLPISAAYAQADALPRSLDATVICQRPPDGKGNFLRRIKKPDGKCVDVISNAYNRQVVSETPAPCEPTC